MSFPLPPPKGFPVPFAITVTPPVAVTGTPVSMYHQTQDTQVSQQYKRVQKDLPSPPLSYGSFAAPQYCQYYPPPLHQQLDKLHKDSPTPSPRIIAQTNQPLSPSDATGDSEDRLSCSGSDTTEASEELPPSASEGLTPSLRNRASHWKPQRIRKYHAINKALESKIHVLIRELYSEIMSKNEQEVKAVSSNDSNLIKDLREESKHLSVEILRLNKTYATSERILKTELETAFETAVTTGEMSEAVADLKPVVKRKRFLENLHQKLLDEFHLITTGCYRRNSELENVLAGICTQLNRIYGESSSKPSSSPKLEHTEQMSSSSSMAHLKPSIAQPPLLGLTLNPTQLHATPKVTQLQKSYPPKEVQSHNYCALGSVPSMVQQQIGYPTLNTVPSHASQPLGYTPSMVQPQISSSPNLIPNYQASSLAPSTVQQQICYPQNLTINPPQSHASQPLGYTPSMVQPQISSSPNLIPNYQALSLAPSAIFPQTSYPFSLAPHVAQLQINQPSTAQPFMTQVNYKVLIGAIQWRDHLLAKCNTMQEQLAIISNKVVYQKRTRQSELEDSQVIFDVSKITAILGEEPSNIKIPFNQLQVLCKEIMDLEIDIQLLSPQLEEKRSASSKKK